MSVFQGRHGREAWGIGGGHWNGISRQLAALTKLAAVSRQLLAVSRQLLAVSRQLAAKKC
jgi:DNA-binding FrmR family transcriptional regulator